LSHTTPTSFTQSFWRLQRRLWGYRLGTALFFQPAIDENGRAVPLRPMLGPFNQFLAERGWCPPWIMTQEECEAYWRSRDNASDGNQPAMFAAKDLTILRFLDTFWSPEVTREHEILELGCNCGANLNGLRQLGYRRLGGVEINPNALAEMKRSFPELAQTATISMMPIDGYLRTAASDSVDVIYTMAVAHHIHPALNDVFGQMTRVARRYVCVIETEIANCTYQFARNFQRVFERLGCTQARAAVPLEHGVSRDYGGYIARLFAVPR
jgi:SAM-dependent methyltransferase